MRKYFGIIPSWLAHNLILIRTIPNDAAASDEDDDGDDVDDVADFPAVFFYQARALRALGLLLADGTPTVGGGKTF